MKKIWSLLLVIVMIVGMTGCGAGGDSAEQTVKNMLDAVKDCDSEKAAQYIDYDALTLQAKDSITVADKEKGEEQVEQILQQLEYKIVSASEDGDKATVKAEITNIDMEHVSNELIGTIIALAFSGAEQEEINAKTAEAYSALLKSEAEKTTTAAVEIQLEKKDGGWRIVSSEKLTDAVLGGLVTVSNGMKNPDGGSGAEAQ